MAFRYTPTPTPSVSPTISLTPSITPTITPSSTSCPYICCLPSNFTAPIGASYVSQMLLLDDDTILVMSNSSEYDGLFNYGVFRIDSCGTLLNRYEIPLLFGSSGSNGGFAKQSDGKIVVGMGRQTFRIEADYSSIDTTFVSGTTDANRGITGIICNDLDEILLVGDMGSNWTYSAGTITYNTNIYKLQANGIPDNTFSGKTITGLGGGADDSELKKDYNTNKFMLDGTSTTFGSSVYQGVVRLNNDFSIDTTFRAAGFSPSGIDGANVYSVESLSNGQYLAGGTFQDYSGLTNQDFLIRLNNDGTLDTSFVAFSSPTTITAINDIVSQSTGRIVIAPTGAAPIRLLNNGGIDTSFTTGTTNGATTSLMLFPNDAILVGGFFTTYNSQPYPKMVKLDEDGELNMCPFPSATPTNTATPTTTPTQMTPTPTQTSTPTPTAETGVLYVYAKFRNAENVLQYQINYGTPDVIGNIDSLSCSYVYTITGLSLGDTVYFTTYSNGILALDTPPADCPNSGFACDQTYIWTNNDYVYITVDGSVFC